MTALECGNSSTDEKLSGVAKMCSTRYQITSVVLEKKFFKNKNNLSFYHIIYKNESIKHFR